MKAGTITATVRKVARRVATSLNIMRSELSCENISDGDASNSIVRRHTHEEIDDSKLVRRKCQLLALAFPEILAASPFRLPATYF